MGWGGGGRGGGGESKPPYFLKMPYMGQEEPGENLSRVVSNHVT